MDGALLTGLTIGMTSPRGHDQPSPRVTWGAGQEREADSGHPKAPPGNAMVPSDGEMVTHWGRRSETMLVMVRALPRKGNSMSRLCLTTRAVLDQLEAVQDEYCLEKTKQWVETSMTSLVYARHVEIQTKIDDNKTTLGIVFTDDLVATVLPGGPAFVAGLRKGDRILKVRTAPTRCNLQPCASSAVCSASAPVLRRLAHTSRRLTEEYLVGIHQGSSRAPFCKRPFPRQTILETRCV
jgi:hypothetical protein